MSTSNVTRLKSQPVQHVTSTGSGEVATSPATTSSLTPLEVEQRKAFQRPVPLRKLPQVSALPLLSKRQMEEFVSLFP